MSYLQDTVAESVLDDEIACAVGDLVTCLSGHDDDLLPFVATHLKTVTELIGPDARGEFLFHCWQSWAAPLPPRERVRLLGIARELGGRLSPCALYGPAADAQRRHLSALTHLCSPLPRPYLLFNHLNELHLRLGVAPAVRAVAAQIVRQSQHAG